MPDQMTKPDEKKFLLQVQKKTGGPWTEIAVGSANVKELGYAMLNARAALAFRVLELIEQAAR